MEFSFLRYILICQKNIIKQESKHQAHFFFQLRQKDLEQDLKNCQQSIPLDIPKYEIKKEIVFDDMTIHFEENETIKKFK